MSEVLARIRVRETAGIRRFLYPLTAYINLPADTDTSTLQMTTVDSTSIPLQVTLWHTGKYRVDFAVSLAPLQGDTDFLLMVGSPGSVPDPLQLTYHERDKLSSVQERFQITLELLGEVRNVVYDGISHLGHLQKQELHEDYSITVLRADPEDKQYKRGLIPLRATKRMLLSTSEVSIGGGSLAAWHHTRGVYADGSPVEAIAEITACKSWVMLNYRLEQPRPGEVIYFDVPLGGSFDVRPITRTIFDCGIDGIYGQADYFGAYINWFAAKKPSELMRWEVGKGHVYENGENLSPVNYSGTTSEVEFQKQRWFHLVNGTQAIAIAITKMPVGWQSLKIKMRQHIHLEFQLSEDAVGPIEFGICCHFLNDVPAIAAATNPQSILLPPVVEVLPL